MKKKLISLLLVFSFLLNTVPLAFAVEDGAGQAENTEVSQVDPNGEEEAGNGGDEDVAAPEGTGEEADVSEDANEAEPGTEGNDGENQMNILAALASQPAMQSAVTLGSAAEAAGLAPVSQTHNAIANGVSYSKLVMRNKINQQAIGYLTEIDLTKNVKLKATYDGYYTPGSTEADRVANAQTISKGQWSMKETTKLAEDYGTIADPAGTVVMATNGDYFNMGTGEPTGYLIMEGNVIKTSYEPYFAILTDGTAVIRDAGTPTDDVMEAISGPIYLLRNGEIEVTADGSMNPRNSVGIREDGSVVFFMAEGRLAPRSIGMDCYEVAAVLKDAGCVTALYLDGGGSATFAAREEGGELKMLSKPSDGHERTISSGMLCISTESQDGVFHHAVITPRDELYTPGSAVQFSAVGVDGSGGAAVLPEGLVWQLAEDSTALGTIDPDAGLFTAANNSDIGTVTVALCQGDTVVGRASVELVKPNEVTFNSTEISMDFDEESDLGLVVHYQNRDVNYKDGDIEWTMEKPNMGSFTGNIFRSTAAGSVTANITAASAFDETVSGTIKVVIGMLPVVVWDFEDKTDDSGSVTQTAEEYYCGENGVLTNHNYGRGGKESIEIVSSADGEPVRFGQKSLKLNYDFTNCGEVTEGACIGTKTDFPVDGTPTGIGVWVYAPEGVGITYEGDGTQAGFWLRGYIKTATNNALAYDFTFEPKQVLNNGVWNGTQPGIYWEGWKYLEADLTNLPAPYTINQGDTLRLMFVNGTKMGTRTAGSIYFDNFQFVYGTNIDDVTDPQVTSITLNNEELVDGGTVYGSAFDLRAYFGDADGKYATGVDEDTVRLFVDGVNVTGKATVMVNDGRMDLYGLQLASGTHSVTVSLCDKAGNAVSATRHFTVADSSTVNPVRVTHVESMAAVGGYVTLEIRGTSSGVKECDMVIRLGSQYENCTVELSPDFEAASGYDPKNCYNAREHTVTIRAVRKSSPASYSANSAALSSELIATVKVQIPENLTDSSTFLYEVKSSVCRNADNSTVTASAPAVTLPVGAAISVSCGPVLTGRDAVLTVTDLKGKPVANAEIFGENGASLGKTGEDGTLTSNAFAAAGVMTVYAKAQDGSISMRYRVYTYAPVTFEKTTFLFNATEGVGATKNITWLSDPTVTERQSLRWRVQGTENWIATTPATTELRTFVTGGYQAANVNSVTLGGIVAGTTYEYQAAAGDKWPDTVESFTAGASGASQKFFVLGDIQAEDTTNITRIFEKLRAGGYDFGIQTGDAVDKPTQFTELNGVVGLLNAKELGSADVIHVLGNHEFEGDGNADIAGSVFALPAHSPGSCWSTTYGDVYVAVINYSGNAGDMKTAAEWLVQDAQKSDAAWKILTVHQPAYYTNATGGNAPMTAYIPAAAEAAGIDVVFSGHDHSFARTNPLKAGEIDAEDGVYYYICGSSGEKSYSINSQNVFDYSKVFAKATTEFNAVYLSVEATQSKMTINVYDVLADGSEQLLDSLTLKSLTGSCAEKGHELADAVCSSGKLICNNCHAAVDPFEWKYTGWARDEATGRKMYFLRGVMQTGWFLVGEDNYCFDENGVAYDGEQVVDEVPFVFENGLVVSGHTGFIKKTNGKTYYYDNGKMALGMTDIGDDTYYFNTKEDSSDYGAMVTGWQSVNSSRYYFDAEGRMWRPIRMSLSEDSGVFTVILTPMEGESFTNGRIAMWSQHNGQDDMKWFRGVKQDNGKWIVTVPMCNYKDLGRYQVHAYDGTTIIAGDRIDIVQNVTHKFTNYTTTTDNCVGAETKVAYCDYGCGTKDIIGWTEKDHTVTAVQDNNVLTVKMADVASHGHTKVKFAVWSMENGQDDLAWYNAEKQADGNWACKVDLTKHHSTGNYQIHAYASTGDSDTMRMAGHVVAQIAAFDDVKPPKVVATVTADYSTMKITVRNAEEYEKISVPVWSEVNGQDDIKWYKATKQAGGSWTCDVDLAAHNSTGRYLIHVYGTKAGKTELIANTTASVAKLPTTKNPTVEAVVSEKLGTMQITVKNAGEYGKVMLPVWSEVNGQDDIKWYEATKQSDGSWTYTVDLAAHNSTGRYLIHVYGTKAGKTELIANTTASVAKLPATKLPTVEAVVSADYNTMKLTVRNTGTYDQIRIPVWSEVNGQDDINWYKATKQSDGSWTYTVDLTAHNSTGRYQIHVYSVKAGKMELIASTTANVAKLPTTKNPTVEAVVSEKLGTMQITVKNAGAYEKVMIPVWSEANGQDDLVWYSAKKGSDGNWTYTVNLKKHNSVGAYQIHVYGTKNGTQTLIAHTRVVVTNSAKQVG